MTTNNQKEPLLQEILDGPGGSIGVNVGGYDVQISAWDGAASVGRTRLRYAV